MKLFIRRGLTTIIITLFFLPIVGFSADETLQAMGVCHQIESNINALVDYTTTKCFPGSGEKRSAIGLILIADKPIFSVEPSKKAWLLVAIAAVGKFMNDHPNIEIEKIFLSDANLMKTRKGFSFRAIFAKVLQKKVYDDQFDLEEMYRQINLELKELNIPSK
jgi:hypothetical protein